MRDDVKMGFEDGSVLILQPVVGAFTFWDHQGTVAAVDGLTRDDLTGLLLGIGTIGSPAVNQFACDAGGVLTVECLESQVDYSAVILLSVGGRYMRPIRATAADRNELAALATTL